MGELAEMFDDAEQIHAPRYNNSMTQTITIRASAQSYTLQEHDKWCSFVNKQKYI